MGGADRATRPMGVVPARARWEARLTASDEAGAWGVLAAALASGVTPEDVLLEVVVPALRSIGDHWEIGELSVADEHRAGAVATRLISRIGANVARRGHKRGSVILAAPPGELHALPVAVAANLLRWKGFDVIELGADTPADALADVVAGEDGLVAVGIACITDRSAQAARRMILALRRSNPSVPIPLGGAAISDASRARRLGADVFTDGRADALLSAVESVLVDKP